TVLDDSGQHRLFVSRNPPERPLSCQVTRSIGGFFAGYAVEIGLTVLVTVGCMVYWRRHVSQTRENGIVYQLVEDLLDSIHEEAENHRRDPVRHPVPGLSVAQLRDHYLPPAALAANSKPTPENADLVRHGWVPMVDANGRTRWYASDARTRVRVWGKAQGYVLRNSNIRETVMEFRGEQHRVWEWIGSYALKPR
ncbi:inner nuclear membrane protein MAN1, partial [Cladochytrium replicatum]